MTSVYPQQPGDETPEETGGRVPRAHYQNALEASAPARRPGEPQGLGGMVAGSITTVAVTALIGATVAWLLQVVGAHLSEEALDRLEPVSLPDPLMCGLVWLGAAAVAIAAMIALRLFVPDGIRFFRITGALSTAVTVISLADGQSPATWVVTGVCVAIPAAALISFAPAVRPAPRIDH